MKHSVGEAAPTRSGRSPATKFVLAAAAITFLTPVAAVSTSTSAAESDERDLDPSTTVQIDDLLQEKASRSPAQSKISSELLFEIRPERNDPQIEALPDLRAEPPDVPDGSALVDIDATVDDALLERIVALGGVVVNSHPRYRAVRARLPLDAIEQLASTSSVTQIRTADQPVTLKDDTSEGDVAHRAASARGTLGVSGAGVSACVLSDSVDALLALQASGDLPAVSILPGQSGNPGISEGTAMLEIVHDLAPGAALGFATAFGGQAQFAQNILNLRASGCDVIVDDIFYLSEPVFQDGIIADAIDSVVADGALYFSAAGNSGNVNDAESGVWEGDFNPVATPPSALAGRGLPVHDFGDGTGLNVITRDSPNLYTLQWADPHGASSNDYELCLLNAAGDVLIRCSTTIQDGNDDPFESINSIGIDDTGLALAIVKTSGSDRFLHLATNRGRLTQATEGASTGHAAADGAFGVAAVNSATAGGGPFTGGPTNPVETFSSDGPRRMFFDATGNPYTPGDFSSTGGVVRQKPDVAAADGVSTATPGFSPFFGTSAAAPHAAGIAALMLDADPTLSKAQVDDLFATTSLDIEAPGIDRDSGYGILNAFALVEAALPAPGVPSAPSGVSGVGGDGEVVVSWTAPGADGGSPITAYTATASPGDASCATTGATTCTVTGLTNGTAYTFTVTATNAVGTGPESVPSAAVVPVQSVMTFDRWGGANRYATSVQISQEAFPAGADVAFLATGQAFADALAGGPAAASLDAPLLLTGTNQMPDVVRDELQRLAPSVVYVLGGPSAVSVGVEADVVTVTGAQTMRLAGSDRYETAAAIAEFGFATADTVYLADGTGFADALSAGAPGGILGRPVVLTGQGVLPDATVAQISRLGNPDVIVLGGPGAISAEVLDSLAVLTSGSVRRVSGANRYETSVAVSADSFENASTVFLATGTAFPDALSAGPSATAMNGPILLTTPACAPAEVVDEVARLGADRIIALGGPGAVSDAARNLTPCP